MREQITRLQEEMCRHNIDFYYVPSEDDHNSEYVAPYFQCRAYLSGFTGSAGSLLVSRTQALLWTDGRYFLQAQEQLLDSGITLMRMGEEGVPTVSQWLVANGFDGMGIGYYARTLSAQQHRQILDPVRKRYSLREESALDLAGMVWEREEGEGRPALTFSQAADWPLSYAGQSREEKLAKFRQFLSEQEIAAYVVTDLSQIAWLLNLRGRDVKGTPVCMAYLLVQPEQAALYVNLPSFSGELTQQLSKAGVVLREYASFYDDLEQLCVPLCADEASVNEQVYQTVIAGGGQVKPSPIPLLRAVKNETEILGERRAHIRDGVALVQFMYWLQHCEVDSSGRYVDESGAVVTECSAAERLEAFRREQPLYQEASFDPIVAVGPHGAIVHYSATEQTDAPFVENTFVLMDTGGQYLDGTTDVTRTIALGTVTPRMKELYTAVLAGHLELQNARFAKGCRGENLDILARTPLWRRGYDFRHGTGHGVGCYLNVHEGPVSIRSHIFEDSRNSAVLEPGMCTSNEPGVYIDGEFGIRLENMMVCVPLEKTNYQEFYGFAPLTMAPWDRNAIVTEQLTPQQKEWLNSYHQLVFQNLAEFLKPEVADWLFSITRPLH